MVQGGYIAAKVTKLEEQFMRDAPREKEKQGDSSSIFSGVAIYVNGYTGQIKRCLLSGVQLVPFVKMGKEFLNITPTMGGT